MNDKERAVMQQALEALEKTGIEGTWLLHDEAITALREALAEQVNTPYCKQAPMCKTPCGNSDCVEQAEQEPVAIGSEWKPCMKLPVVVHVREQREGESHVSTREGITPVRPDDLIMRGVAGEEYPIGRELFNKTYTFDTAAPVQQAEQERKYGELAGTHNWTPPNYTDEQWQKLDQEYQDHVAKQEPIGYLDESDLRGLSQGNAVWLHPEDQGRMVSVYAAPVRTKDLTDDEIREAVKQVRFDGMTDKTFQFARSVIAADREKNK